MFESFLCYYEPSFHQTKSESIRRSLTSSVKLLTCLLLLLLRRRRRGDSIRDFEETFSRTRRARHRNSSAVRLRHSVSGRLTSCFWVFPVYVHTCESASFTLNKVELRRFFLLLCVAGTRRLPPSHTFPPNYCVSPFTSSPPPPFITPPGCSVSRQAAFHAL